MTPLIRLGRVRTFLAAGVALRALLWGLAAGATVMLGVGVVRAEPTRAWYIVAIVATLATAAALLWRDRSVASLLHVALWVEEHDTSLDYTLVSAVELNDASLVTRDDASWSFAAIRRSARAAVAPLATLVVAGGLGLLVPGTALSRVANPLGVLRGIAFARDTATTRLTDLRATIVAPAYANRKEQTLNDPTDIRALTGSRITLHGHGDPRGIVAASGGDSIRAMPDANGWQLVIGMPSTAVALRLADRTFRRVVALEPEIDAPPSVTLSSPVHDTVLRAPHGRISLAADAEDDVGVASASFEFIVSSGEGENFTFKSGTLGAVRPNAKRASIAAALLLDSLALKPGDIVHVRAVARDANNVNGPGVGTSDTRAIRIARTDEYDSVAVDAAPPSDEDKSVISERMLIMLAEALDKRAANLKRDSLVAESHSIAVDQRRLRRTVGELVFTRLGGSPQGEEHTDDDSPARAKSMEELLARADSATNASTNMLDFGEDESPVVAVNKPLLEAYNAMWDATNQLEVGAPGAALPHMRAALAAIQRARQAERLYLRGRPPQVVIDVNKARLQGKDKGSPSTRRATSASDSLMLARSDRFARIVDIAARDPRAAADSLLVLRVDALTDDPPFAAALGAAADAIRKGKSTDASNALGRARRALAGAPVAHDSLTRWSGGGFR